ncbi:hypothetical protein [Corynebacterium renale]|uniref:hypothetical protein n=1 Tax=Corynebacterium renale TaxID=1724 RepID=UPI001F3657B9|nr:hypothetical protein [Corynebacterium renale]
MDLGAAGSAGSGGSGVGGSASTDSSGWKGVFDEAKKMFTAADKFAATALGNSPADPAGKPAGTAPAGAGANAPANTQASSPGARHSPIPARTPSSCGRGRWRCLARAP